MKLSPIVLSGVALLISVVDANANSKKGIVHPQFEPYTKVLADDSFFEQFDTNLHQWKASNAKKNGGKAYNGKWEIEESTVNAGFKGDKGLVVKSEAALHAISVPLEKVFDNTNNTLVLQYEVKFQKGLNCGGAYVKLLSADAQDVIPEQFSDETPYQIMFGPDKCGSTNKVHFIFKRKNPITGNYEEKVLKVPPMARIVKTSVLYTLILKPTQEFEIRIDGDVVRAGSLFDKHFFDINPAKEVVDKKDKKPDDWVEEEFVRDPDATKPDDWDEDEPFMIPDTTATKPSDWDEDMPASVPDPEATKPEYWDDDEDGKWKAPLIKNQNCENHGCGPWEAPKVRNPKFKGKWFPPMVKNPNYKGEWKPRLIQNPDYYDDKTPADLEPIRAIGFELWTMTDSILFDNIYLGHSIDEAEDIGNSTFLPKLKIEQQEAAASAPSSDYEPEKPASPTKDDDSWISSLLDSVVVKVVLFLRGANAYVLSLSSDPIHTLLNRPGEAVLYSSIFLSFFTLIYGFWSAVLQLITGRISTGTESVDDSADENTSSEQNSNAEVIKPAEKSTESEKNETAAFKR